MCVVGGLADALKVSKVCAEKREVLRGIEEKIHEVENNVEKKKQNKNAGDQLEIGGVRKEET